MGTFYAQYPASASAGANPSVGTAGAPAPGSATEVAGVGPDGNLHPLSTDNSGVLNVNISSEPGAPFHVIVDSSALPTGASTSANQTSEITQLTAINASTAALNTRLAGALVPVAFDEVDITYIVAGNGTGQAGTVQYRLATVLVKTLTLTYDASNRLSTVVAS